MVADTPTENEARQSNLEKLATCQVIPSDVTRIDEYTIDSLLSQVWGVHGERNASKLKPNKENRHPAYRDGQGQYEGISNSYRKWAMKFDFEAVPLYYQPINQLLTTTKPTVREGNSIRVLDHKLNWARKDMIQRKGDVVTWMKPYTMWMFERRLPVLGKDGRPTHYVEVKYDGIYTRVIVRTIGTNYTERFGFNGTMHIGNLIEESKSKNSRMWYGVNSCPAYLFANLFAGIRVRTEGSTKTRGSVIQYVKEVRRFKQEETSEKQDKPKGDKKDKSPTKKRFKCGQCSEFWIAKPAKKMRCPYCGEPHN